MEIIGIVEKVFERETPHFKKKIAKIKDSIHEDCIWFIECRGELKSIVSMLKLGDQIRVDVLNDGRLDTHGNYYNNVIAKKIERI